MTRLSQIITHIAMITPILEVHKVIGFHNFTIVGLHIQLNIRKCARDYCCIMIILSRLENLGL